MARKRSKDLKAISGLKRNFGADEKKDEKDGLRKLLLNHENQESDENADDNAEGGEPTEEEHGHTPSEQDKRDDEKEFHSQNALLAATLRDYEALLKRAKNAENSNQAADSTSDKDSEKDSGMCSFVLIQ